MKATKMNTKNCIGALAGAILLVGSSFAQAPDITKIKADAEAGNADAQARLAIAYFNGNGVAKDEREALKWVQKSADGGSALGQLNLGNMYLNGGCGLKQDPSEAFKWFTKSAEQRHRGGQCMMGESYLFGQGVKKNEQEAAKWFALAANAGSPRAQGYYAYMLANGMGVEKNIEEALSWCKKAAEAGDAGAKQTLPHIQRVMEMESKTPKSFIGVEFGKKIEEIGCQGNALKTSDGSAVHNYLRNGKKFRKFTDYNRMEVFGSITSHEVFKFNWHSEEFPKGTTRKDACDEIVKTCEVISKKFNGEYSEKSGVYTIIFGWMKITIEYDSMGRYLNMWVINSSYESKAKREVEALKDAEGDGSDAL